MQLDMTEPTLVPMDYKDSPIARFIPLPQSQDYVFSKIEPLFSYPCHAPEGRYLCHDQNGTLLYQANPLKNEGGIELIAFDYQFPFGNHCKIYNAQHKLRAFGALHIDAVTPYGINSHQRSGLWYEITDRGSQEGFYDAEGLKTDYWIETGHKKDTSLKIVSEYNYGILRSQIGFKSGCKTPFLERKGDVTLYRTFDPQGGIEQETRRVAGTKDGVQLGWRDHVYTQTREKTYYQNGEEIAQPEYWWNKNSPLLKEKKFGEFISNLFGANKNTALFLPSQVRKAYALAYEVSA